MKWLFNMKPKERGQLILALGILMIAVQWYGLFIGTAPRFATAFTIPGALLTGLMYLFFPETVTRNPGENWVANGKRLWKTSATFIIVFIVVGLLHFQLQTIFFG